jgi:uncharacterized membrane protein (UPF0127 family)
VLAVLLLAAVAVACSDDDAPSSAPTTAASTTSTAPTTAVTTVSSTPATAPGTTASSRPMMASTTMPAPVSTTTVPVPATTSSTRAPRQSAAALGFGEIAFTVTTAGSGPADAATRCALLADTEQQRQRGLMGRRDLAGFDAMIFRFPTDSSGAFYMRNVPVALSIAWFRADGRFVSATDMAPCPDQSGCPTYAPTGPYRLAMEVLQGGLSALGVGEGSVLTLGGACPS